MSDNSNMQGFTLTSKEVKRLRAIHRKLRQRHEADGVICCVPFLKFLIEACYYHPRPRYGRSGSLICKTIPHSGFGEQISRLGSVGFDLAAKLGQMNAEVMRILGVVLSPYLFE
jgi:hypothetical protein